MVSVCIMTEPTRPTDALWTNYIRQARICFASKNIRQAIRMCQLALQEATPFGQDDWRVLETERLCCRVLMHLKEYDKAHTILSEMLMTVHGKYGGSSPELLDVALSLAEVLEYREEYGRAERLMLHVMFNHPRRISEPEDQDYAAVKQKYHALKKKTDGIERRHRIA
jgi:hypothetical protein